MPNIFRDPVGWSASAVSTSLRYWFMAAMFVLLQFLLVYVAVTGGWRPASSLAAFLAWFHFLFLFALRRLYLKLSAPEASQHAA
jgi:hypothetical protein